MYNKEKSNADQQNLLCPHINEQNCAVDIGKFQISSCTDCDYSGPNLWICLQHNCFNIGCSEEAKDHSTLHFNQNQTHCVHINISSLRAWCYVCEREVYLLVRNSSDLYELLSKNKEIFSKYISLRKTTSPSSMGLVGLQNIANTCYMNSALQALSNIQPMTYYFLNCENNTVNTTQTLAKSYQRLIKDLWCAESEKKDPIVPRGILYSIRSVNPMFRGFQQHDTQEFLRCFMDQLHEELREQRTIIPHLWNVRQANVKSYMEEFDLLATSESNSSNESDYETCDSDTELSNQVNSEFNLNYTKSARYDLEGSAKFNQQPNVKEHSIISDIFDGKLLSSVQCLTCDRISAREETFQDLSLPIPTRDFLNMLHQTHTSSSQTLNSIDSAIPKTSESWIFWLWSLFRSWLWGPSVTLYDCMSSFFSADELKGDNMYSCDKCNKLRTGIKYSKILELPEVLCIHLKRFRHDLSYSAKISSFVQFPIEGFDLRPYLHTDCKSNVAVYNLVSVICHHGTVGGGHYTCFALNALTNRWYEYDDQHVTEVSVDIVQNSQAYVLFYRKQNQQMDLIRLKANELSALNPVTKTDIRFYISREWLLRFSTFAEPGPVSNWTLLCSHGGIIKTKVAVPISQILWEFFYEKFGGGPVINMLFDCEICKSTSKALVQRRNYELSFFTKHNEIDIRAYQLECGPIYAISMQWLRKWQQFVRGLTHNEPGPITNSSIIVSQATNSYQLRSLQSGSDFAQLNNSVWRFLYNIYGGGPEIILRGSLNEENEIVSQNDHEGDNSERKEICTDNTSSTEKEGRLDSKKTDSVANNHLKGMHLSLEIKLKPSKLSNLHFKESRRSILTLNSRKLKPCVFHRTYRKKSRRNLNSMKTLDIIDIKDSYYPQKTLPNSIQGLNEHSTDLEVNGGNAFKKPIKYTCQCRKKKLAKTKRNSPLKVIVRNRNNVVAAQDLLDAYDANNTESES